MKQNVNSEAVELVGLRDLARSEDLDLWEFLARDEQASVEELLGRCPRAEWALTLAVAAGYSTQVLLTAMARLIAECAAEVAPEELALARGELGLRGRRVLRRRDLQHGESRSTGAAAHLAHIAGRLGRSARRGTARDLTVSIEGELQRVLNLLVGRVEVGEEGGAFRSQAAMARRRAALRELGPPLGALLVAQQREFTRDGMPPLDLETIALTSALFGGATVLSLGATALVVGYFPALLVGIGSLGVALAFVGHRFGGGAAVVCGWVGVFALAAGVFSGPAAVRGVFGSPARGIRVADVSDDALTPWFTFSDAQLRHDLIVAAGRRAGESEGTRLVWIAPVVGPRWTPEHPVSLWAICHQGQVYCQTQWTNGTGGVPPGAIQSSDIERALAAAVGYGLTSGPRARFLEWKNDPPAAARRNQWLALWLPSVAWLVALAGLVLHRRRDRG